MTVSDRPPVALRGPGRRLWASVVADYELEQHELILLEQACRTADVLEALRLALADGVLITEAGRVRPELVELRQQRIVLARLLAALRLPLGAEQDGQPGHGPVRLQRRAGVRGPYRLGPAS